MHWHTCTSLLDNLGRAVEQLGGCLAKQAEVTGQGQGSTVWLGGYIAITPTLVGGLYIRPHSRSNHGTENIMNCNT